MGHVELGAFRSLDARALEEISQLAERLSSMLRGVRAGLAEPANIPGVGSQELVALAGWLLKQRRMRDSFFPGLFAEPAWDMLLDLYVAEAAGKPISVSSACAAACVPPTTALRVLTVLEDEGIVVRKPHARDRRSRLLALSPSAHDALSAHLAQMLQLWPVELADPHMIR